MIRDHPYLPQWEDGKFGILIDYEIAKEYALYSNGLLYDESQTFIKI